jgi:hypothetical protein
MRKLIPMLALLMWTWAPMGAAAEPEPHGSQGGGNGSANGDYQTRLSSQPEDEEALWIEPGLRIELALDRGILVPYGPSPRIETTTFRLRTRLRVDRLWSLAATFGYALARGELTGMRWSALIEPIFHPIPPLGISLGLGLGGLSLTRAGGGAPPAGASEEIASRTLADGERMYACSGAAWLSQARIEYLAIVGGGFATGPYLQADLQWTSCTEEFGTLDRETGQPALGRQWWLNPGAALGWWFSWR